LAALEAAIPTQSVPYLPDAVKGGDTGRALRPARGFSRRMRRLAWVNTPLRKLVYT